MILQSYIQKCGEIKMRTKSYQTHKPRIPKSKNTKINVGMIKYEHNFTNNLLIQYDFRSILNDILQNGTNERTSRKNGQNCY